MRPGNLNRSKATFFDQNDDRVNRMMCRILGYLSVAFLLVHFAAELGLFGIKSSYNILLTIAGIFTTLTPAILRLFHVNRKILKYYIVSIVAAGVFVCSLLSVFRLEMLFLLPVVIASYYAAPAFTAVTSFICYILFYIVVMLEQNKIGGGIVLSIFAGEEGSDQRIFLIEFLALAVLFTVLSKLNKKKITSSEVMALNLRESKMLYNVAIENSADIIFEYNVEKDIIQLFGNTKWSVRLIQQDADSRIIKDFIKAVLNNPGLNREDREKIKLFFSAQNSEQFDIKISNEEVGDIWLRFSGSPVIESGEIKKIVGKISDITISKQAEFEEKFVQSIDTVTNLPNAETAKQIINEYLFKMKKEELAAVFVVHADNFNNIERNYGIIFANTVLEQTAALLKNIFDDEDIIYRNDDVCFVVFAKKMVDRDVDKYAIELLSRTGEVYVGEKKDIGFGFSVGYVTTEKSTYFEQLLKWASKACAGVILDGGNEARFYSETLSTLSDREIIRKASEYHGKDAVYNNDDIIAFSYALLERTTDIKSGMNQLLARIGREFEFIMVEINEADEESLTVMNSYCWSTNPDKFEPEHLTFETKEEFYNWISLFNEEEGYEHNSENFEYIDSQLKDAIRQNMPSKLSFAIYDEGVFAGEISFSKEDPSYNWPSEIKSTLRELSRIIATHIVKQKADNASRAKSDFLSNMSHEIRTPMNAICGMTELILSTPLSEEAKDYASTIKASASNLLGIINDILDFSKIESGKMEVIPDTYQFASMMHEIISIITVRLNDKNVSLMTEFDKEIPAGLVGDEMRIRQILINLLNNAAKFTEEGSITLSARWEKTSIDHGNIHFAVKDTGIGIKSDDLAKLFSAFTRVDQKRNRKTEGTGLGLSISKKLVDIMEGQLNVESVYGEGSTFSFWIPQEVSDPTPSNFDGKRSVQQNIENTVLKAKFTAPDAKILIVDDNFVNLRVASGLMNQYKMQITTATSGPDSIALIDEGKEFDIIFMDHMMPGMDGVETVHRIREKHTPFTDSVPIIALTANAIKGVEKMFLENGFNGYLSKPIEVPKLHTVLKQYIPESKQHDIDNSNEEEDNAELKEDIALFDKLKTISELDTETGLKNNGGIIKNYYEIVNVYVISGKKEFANAKKYFETGDIKDYTITVHGIKSASRGIGAVDLGEEAYALELAGKENNTEFIETNHPAFMEHYQKVLDEIKEKLGIDDEIKKEPVSDEALLEACQKAEEFLNDMDDMSAMDVLKPVLNGIYSNDELEPLLEEIAEDVDNLDCEPAIEKIKKVYELLEK